MEPLFDDMVHPAWHDAFERVYNKMVKYLGLTSQEARQKVHHQLQTAFSYAYETSQGHFRKNGATLFAHIVHSVDLLLLLKPDVVTMQTCLLHETIKECGVTKTQLTEHVGEEVAELVERFANLKKIRLHADTQEEILQLRQMLLVMANDVRVVLVKLATRLAGLLTLEGLSREKQVRLAKEMLEIYGPIAGRLGVFALKFRIEDEAFRVLHPKLYNKTEAELASLVESNKDILETCRQHLIALIRQHKLSGKIYGRVKSVYSTAHKLHQKHSTHVAELYDIFALRVIVPTKEDCYRLLGYIHEKYPPVAHRMKDYIAAPKPNNYQSLHTSVIGMFGDNPLRPVEVQIRTPAMDEVAEYGVASHGAYKEQGSIADHGELWQRKLALINKEYKRKGRILGDEGTDLGQIIAKVFVLTPKGDVMGLPREATPLDFAYAVHTDVGHHCIGATVNGRAVPLSYTLRTGDTVAVTTRATHWPTGTSLLYAKTSSARQKINAYLKEEQHESFVERGRQMLDTLLMELEKPRLDPSMTVLDALIPEGQSRSIGKERMLLQIGKGSTTAISVVKRLYPDVVQAQRVQRQRSAAKPTAGQWMVGGDPHIPYTLAKCCMTRPGRFSIKDLVAYISSEHIIRVHKKTCSHVAGKPSSRFLSVDAKPCN